MASIIERRNRRGGLIGYQALVRRKGYPTQTRTFRTYRDAEIWAASVEAEIGHGTWRPTAEAERTTLAEALDRYRSEITPGKRAASRSRERDRIAAWCRHPLSRRSLASVRGKDIADYIRSRASAGAGPNTVRLDLALISHLYTVARSRWGMESLGNPVALVRGARPKLPRGRDRRLLPGEEPRLLAACRAYGGPIEPLVLLALETAMRRGELASMRWEHLGAGGTVLRIPQTKAGEPRRVPLSSRAREVLASLPRRIDGSVGGVGADSITQAFARALVRARADYEAECRGAGEEPDPRILTGLRFHDLRHEATSRLFEKGLNPMQAAAITGHKTLQMLKRYTHLRAEDLVGLLG